MNQINRGYVTPLNIQKLFMYQKMCLKMVKCPVVRLKSEKLKIEIEAFVVAKIFVQYYITQEKVT